MLRHISVKVILSYSFPKLLNENPKQECIPVGCVPPALYHMGGLCDRDTPWIETPLDRDTPGQRPLWTETPLDRDPLERDPWIEIPLDRGPLSEQRTPTGQRNCWTEIPQTETPWTETP